MEVLPIPIEDVERLLRPREGGPETVDRFTPAQTEGCLLNCRRNLEKKSRKGKKVVAAVYDTDPFTLLDVDISSKNGCRGCTLLGGIIRGVFSVYPDLDTGGELRWIGPIFILEATSKDGSRREIQLFNITGAQKRLDMMPKSNILMGNTALLSSFNRAHGQLQKCETEHAQCGTGRHVRLPKRLVDVTEITSPDGAGRPGVRLKTTEDREGTYVCLSHC
ncbi:hypothetical protein BJX96DRAFT_138703 [Aspergillus floccosus]